MQAHHGAVSKWRHVYVLCSAPDAVHLPRGSVELRVHVHCADTNYTRAVWLVHEQRISRRLSGATFDLQGRSRLSAERLRALTVLTTRYLLEQIELSWLILCHNRRRDTTGMLRVIPRALRRLAALVLHAEAVLLLFLPWLRVILVYPDGAHLTSGRL
jgi:hypothetical protein